MTRDASRISGRSWFGDVEVVQADALKTETLENGLSGIHTAYYMIRSRTSQGEKTPAS